MRDPELLPRLVGEVEVTARAHREVRTLRVAQDRVDRPREVGGALDARRGHAVERRVNRLTHLRLPVASRVVGHVDSTGRGRQLSLSGAQRHDAVRVPRQLGRERHSLPALARVARVQEDGGLADDPAFAVEEGELGEAIIELLVRVQVGKRTRLPRFAAVKRLEERALVTDNEPIVRILGIEVDVEEDGGVGCERQIHCRPRRRVRLGEHRKRRPIRGERSGGGDGGRLLQQGAASSIVGGEHGGDGGALRVHRLTGHRARLRDERRLAGGEAGEEGGCPHGQQCGVRAEI